MINELGTVEATSGNSVEETLQQILDNQLVLDQKLDEILDGQERNEMAVANLSGPGTNYSIEYSDE